MIPHVQVGRASLFKASRYAHNGDLYASAEMACSIYVLNKAPGLIYIHYYVIVRSYIQNLYMHNQNKNIKGDLILAAPPVGVLLATTPVLALVLVAVPVDEAADVTPDADIIVVEAVLSELTEVVALTLVELVAV
jgi:hypothetical protein